jgi:hypothetical protein
VIASIDGGLGEAGMILGYRSSSATTGQWYLSMPDMAMGAFTSWEIVGGQVNANTQSQWVQLVGVWNDFTGKMTLYVNGTAVASVARETSWWGDGTVQIGRANFGGAWGGNFTGQIAGVHVFNRVATADEAVELGFQAAMRSGYWQFNQAGTGGISPEYDGGLNAKLEGDAFISDGGGLALNGIGHLALDGAADYAWVDAPTVDTARSFSLTARVKLDTAVPDRTMTVMSIPGNNASAIEVGYAYECDGDATTIEGCWQLRLTKTDAIGTTVVVNTVNSLVDPSDAFEGQSIAVVYDSITGQARLYVNGVASKAILGLSPSAWTATGDLQIGRGFGPVSGSSGYRHYFSGAIDEVRAFDGVLTAAQVSQLNFAFDEHPEI